jgi:transposase-like protein
VANSQSHDAPSCPRCRTDAQFLGAGYDGDSNWFLCPTCRYAWQKTTAATRGSATPPRNDGRAGSGRYGANA